MPAVAGSMDAMASLFATGVPAQSNNAVAAAA
jgi:hypothetical protein